MAQDFIVTEGFEQRELIRSNWDALGYAYWFTSGMIEFWRNDATGHVAEMTTY